jgi:hypothetical protein
VLVTAHGTLMACNLVVPVLALAATGTALWGGTETYWEQHVGDVHESAVAAAIQGFNHNALQPFVTGQLSFCKCLY